MDNLIEQRTTIKFCFKVGLSAKNSFEMLQKSYDELCLKKTAVYEWFGRFREGQESVVDDERSGRPSTTQTNKNIAHVTALLKEDRRITCHLAVERLDIPKSIVRRLLIRIAHVRPEKFRDHEFFILRNNASTHNATINQQFLAAKHVTTIYHPLYSPDLNPLNYFAIPKLKLELKGDYFE